MSEDLNMDSDRPTPQALGFCQPAEWEPHTACWLAFPSDRDLWLEDLEAAQAEFIALARAIAQSEPIEILVPNLEIEAIAKAALKDIPVRFHLIPFGDIWMRDISPIFTTKHQEKSQENTTAALTFQWNGWGHKYMLEGDDLVAERIAKSLQIPTFQFPWVLEGGAVEVDGQGTCLTTKQCLLNPNRNPEMSQAEIESGLKQALGVRKILWIESGLLNDHTDGHIDTIARFVAPSVVMCMQAASTEDPNYQVLEDIAEQLSRFTDARDRPLTVVRIPSPGLVLDSDGEIMPASYLNFYIANGGVIVPTYDSPFDRQAVEAISAHFPNRTTVGLSAKTILLGGGAFHCITCHQPA
ncbi:agmatine deiminase family protein [Tumidithrix elongata RA019]|uniref:Agmatine deiminase family protein n=1 Tax=Tumidithrix elongata BACA0141 TaxID=2716417 RepID=A0AAW9PUM5_9CYAN|nr:agmatine deiminase family protein [Tumidithrix elongata RA019]